MFSSQFDEMSYSGEREERFQCASRVLADRGLLPWQLGEREYV